MHVRIDAPSCPRTTRVSAGSVAAVTAGQIVIAAEVTVDSPDFGHLEPMVTATQTELAKVGIDARPEVLLADAG